MSFAAASARRAASSAHRRGLAPLALCLCVGAALAGWSCEPRDQTPLGRGRRIFQRSCSGCHGGDGRGVARIGLVKPPRNLTDPAFQAQFSDDQLRQVIRVGKGQMPAFGGMMADEDLNHVITFIRSLVPPPAPPPSLTAPASAPDPSPRSAE